MQLVEILIAFRDFIAFLYKILYNVVIDTFLEVMYMKLSKECINKMLDLIIESVSFSDKDITKQEDFDNSILDLKPTPISNIVKKCSEFSSEEIKSALFLLKETNFISIGTDEMGRAYSVSLRPNSYSKILRDLT